MPLCKKDHKRASVSFNPTGASSSNLKRQHKGNNVINFTNLPTLRHDAWVSRLRTINIDLTLRTISHAWYTIQTNRFFNTCPGGTPLEKWRGCSSYLLGVWMCGLVPLRVLKPKMTAARVDTRYWDKDLWQYFQNVVEKKVFETYLYHH